MKKVYLETHGCQMNVYDSSKMLDVLREVHDMRVTDNPDEADLLLLNTCSIREKAQEKVFSSLGRFNLIKKSRPHVVIGVGGCVASQEGEAIWDRAPYVDLIFGPQTLHRLGTMLSHVLEKRQPMIDVSFPSIEKFDHLPEPRVEGVSAYVSIMEGCSKYCSFCVVPYTRGEEVSRPLDDVLTEVSILAEKGVREVTLLGQNVNDYRGRAGEGVADLATLLDYLSVIDGIQRLRFTTSHPTAFSKRLIEAYERLPKLVDHLHLPVQSGSDRILSSMKRGYTILEYKSKIRKLRAIRPNISITSDFIVGFPGETDRDFDATLRLAEELEFDNSFTFIYSARPGTPAAQLQDDVTLDVKKERLAKLQNLIFQNTQNISMKMIGEVHKILVTGFSDQKNHQIEGRTENNRFVHLKGDETDFGSVIPVSIRRAGRYALHGEKVALT